MNYLLITKDSREQKQTEIITRSILYKFKAEMVVNRIFSIIFFNNDVKSEGCLSF